MFEKLNSELKIAMKSGNKERRDIIRYAISTIKSIAKKDNREVTEKDVITGINRLIKQNREVIETLKQNNRDYSKEVKAIKIWEEFIPKKLSKNELEKVLNNIIEVNSNIDKGSIMKELSKRNDIDMKMANEILNKILNR